MFNAIFFAILSSPTSINRETRDLNSAPIPTRAAAITDGTANEPNNEASKAAIVDAKIPSITMIMILVF